MLESSGSLTRVVDSVATIQTTNRLTCEGLANIFYDIQQHKITSLGVGSGVGRFGGRRRWGVQAGRRGRPKLPAAGRIYCWRAGSPSVGLDLLLLTDRPRWRVTNSIVATVTPYKLYLVSP
jgi:hypothetical protein